MNPSRSTRCADLIDNYLCALTGAPWQRNFRDGAPAEVFHDGKTTTTHGDLIQDYSVVADLYRHHLANRRFPRWRVRAH
jgi:hypothetical protein